MGAEKMNEIEAVGFDIDGTLYPQWKLHIRMVYHFLKYNHFFMEYGLVRNEMHHMGLVDDFRSIQDECMARRIGCTKKEASEQIQQIIYDGLGRYFPKIHSYPDVEETFRIFHESGLKIAVLSDFPPEQKGNMWGCRKYCDVVLGSEELGSLKPSPFSFKVMAEKLGVDPEHILYVGNSIKYDVRGAKNAGMKTACIMPIWRCIPGLLSREADFSFRTYRQLQHFVLQ